MKRHQVWIGIMLLCGGVAQAEVRVEVPQDFRILTVSDGKLQDDRHAVLADGEQQLLVRYEGVIPSRNSSDNDRQIRSEPQVIRYEARGQQLKLQAAVPTDENGMERYAKVPAVSLQGAGQPVAAVQDELVIKGMQIGMDWPARLAEYNRGAGKAALMTAAATATVSGETQTASVPANELERQLQRLFLQADPELRKRFIGWAVPRL
ncbi:DUF2057 domain-containing protein [Aeromonas aquatica]|uniref:DUF2057 domain-containing protein n=1 Tax=Aeromonas aquatica TaxID=558964 RepID=UPI00286F1DE5|nr:DUF2057 domain-containing protein [Aeromonas aquatica]